MGHVLSAQPANITGWPLVFHVVASKSEDLVRRRIW